MTDPWVWATADLPLLPGSTFTTAGPLGNQPVPTGVQQLEVVVEHFVQTAGNMPNYTITLFDISRPSGTSPISITDNSTDSIKTIDLRGTSNLVGREFKLTVNYTSGPVAPSPLPFMLVFRWHGGTE